MSEELEMTNNLQDEEVSLFPEDFDVLMDEDDEDDEGEAVEYRPGIAFGITSQGELDLISDSQLRLQSSSGIES